MTGVMLFPAIKPILATEWFQPSLLPPPSIPLPDLLTSALPFSLNLPGVIYRGRLLPRQPNVAIILHYHILFFQCLFPPANEKLSKQGLLSKAETPNLLALKSCWEAAAERGGANSDAVRDVDQAGIHLLFH